MSSGLRVRRLDRNAWQELVVGFADHNYRQSWDYSVAAAIDAAAALLDAGDVILIEQQAVAHDNYAPVEVEPAVFDAIASAVAKGVIVVEPSGNGGQDLDATYWFNAFDALVAQLARASDS